MQPLIQFSQGLITDFALPVLSKGYGNLVQTLRQNRELASLAKEHGLGEVLSSDHPEIARLKKSNKELVTSAEKEAESLMAQAVRNRYPGHAIVGEEHGYQPGNQTRWVFDPVDGTSAMIRTAMAEAFGVSLSKLAPSFGITVAIVEDDKAILGIVSELKPFKDGLAAANTWLGASNQPTLCNGRGVNLPQAPATLTDATLASTVPEVMFNTFEKWSGYQALAEATSACITDQNCVGFVRLLQEQSGIDIVYEADLAYHDAAALVPVLQGAGVRVTDDKGQPLRFHDSAIAQEFRVLAAQSDLHSKALEKILAGVPTGKNQFKISGSMHQGYAQKFPASHNH